MHQNNRKSEGRPVDTHLVGCFSDSAKSISSMRDPSTIDTTSPIKKASANAVGDQMSNGQLYKIAELEMQLRTLRSLQDQPSSVNPNLSTAQELQPQSPPVHISLSPTQHQSSYLPQQANLRVNETTLKTTPNISLGTDDDVSKTVNMTRHRLTNPLPRMSPSCADSKGHPTNQTHQSPQSYQAPTGGGGTPVPAANLVNASDPKSDWRQQHTLLKKNIEKSNRLSKIIQVSAGDSSYMSSGCNTLVNPTEGTKCNVTSPPNTGLSQRGQTNMSVDNANQATVFGRLNILQRTLNNFAPRLHKQIDDINKHTRLILDCVQQSSSGVVSPRLLGQRRGADIVSPPPQITTIDSNKSTTHYNPNTTSQTHHTMLKMEAQIQNLNGAIELNAKETNSKIDILTESIKGLNKPNTLVNVMAGTSPAPTRHKYSPSHGVNDDNRKNGLMKQNDAVIEQMVKIEDLLKVLTDSLLQYNERQPVPVIPTADTTELLKNIGEVDMKLSEIVTSMMSMDSNFQILVKSLSVTNTDSNSLSESWSDE